MSPAVAKLHCCAARIVIEISGALLSRGKVCTPPYPPPSYPPSGALLSRGKVRITKGLDSPLASHGAAFGLGVRVNPHL